ncbi:hypothetical protein BpHYR1_015080 [Brachionus plicatilis]|uniref:Uncharacterized protein n=1 Tax=Brachionus plicatilis TaxID=10195 RepID=A0A3M7QAM4_BRAPC|nr:hypothetical protein BpHYR1_015080 [Brachionus plicatilis]
MISRGKSLKNNVVHLMISVTLIQVMNSLETTEEALQSISVVWAKWLKNSCVDGQKIYVNVDTISCLKVTRLRLGLLKKKRPNLDFISGLLNNSGIFPNLPIILSFLTSSNSSQTIRKFFKRWNQFTNSSN